MLRPISFSIPSSTELRIAFNKRLSEGLGKNNFSVESISGNVGDLIVRKVEVFGTYVIVTTSPQVAGNFYTLLLKDDEKTRFMSENGVPLVNDDVSRELFFVGLKRHNPVRDRMYYNVPKVYNLENSNLSKILSAQAEEIFKAQKDLGEVLSNNFISVSVDNERRTRSSGATDRLENEGVYEVSRVSKSPENSLLTFKKIEYSPESSIFNHDSMPKYPVSLQEIFVRDEEVSINTADNGFEGFLLSLSKNNIIRVIGVRHIRPDDIEDCDGNIGTDYAINICKYSLNTNKYDPEYAFENRHLKRNQVLLSAFGNISEPVVGDKIIVSYLYRDESINVNEASIEAYNIADVSSESIPSNVTRFFLKNAPIVDANNDVPEKDGVVFLSNYLDNQHSEVFSRELAFSSSKMPSKPGEYAINYATGEVIVAGEAGSGTGSKPITAKYLYRNIFLNNLDYYIENNDILAVNSRPMVDSPVVIDFNYENIFVKDVDYSAPCHTEVFNEHVGNSFESAFVVKPKSTPITDVHRIFNQTTGEEYPLLYHTSDEIHFSGKRSPELRTQENEVAKFSKLEEEQQPPTAVFVCPTFSVRITANASNSSIAFEPGIPSELISENSTDYFVRSLGLHSNDVSDIQIRFFGQKNSQGLINSLSISPTVIAPSLGETVTIGPRVLRFDLDNPLVLNNNLDAIGSHVNTSVSFSDKLMFKREKFFRNTPSPANLSSSQDENFRKIIQEDNSEVFFENIARIRKVGDYGIDYTNGVIYVAVGAHQGYAPIRVNYSYGRIDNFNKNIISLTGAYKKNISADTASTSNIVYGSLKNTAQYSYIEDLESSLLFFKEGSVALDSNSNMRDTCTVLEDYTVISPYNISDIRGVYNIRAIEGHNLKSSILENRTEDISAGLAELHVLSGGANIFDGKKMSYHQNIIDLKIHKKIRSRSIGDSLVVSVNDENFKDIYEISHEKTGEVVFDDKLNVEKIFGLDIVYASAPHGGEAYVDIRSGIDLSKVDSEDFLLDTLGRRFEIVSADEILSRVTVKSPAINNVEALSPELGEAKVVVKAEVKRRSDGVDIFIPSDSFISSGDIIKLTYVQDFIPSSGSRVALDCSHGNIYVNYLYSYDDIYISYEYGDNEIDWSISNSVSEGEQYYVSYKYGASRRALKNNFGVLTKIPYFQRFPLEADREVYRSGLQGVMNAFSNGAMKPSFETLVKSFTGVKPNIEESFFGNWILGRDSLSPEQVSVEGPISFRDSKFGEGIYVDKGTVISTPALSNINLDEGTLSAWVTPDWAGIDNDATLTVHVDNLGLEEYQYKFGDNIFDYESGFSTFSSDDAVGIIDLTGSSITIHNYTHKWDENKEEAVEIGAFAIKSDKKAADRIVKTEFEVSLKVGEFSAPADINPPRRRPSEDIPNSRVKLGLAGLGRSLSDSSRGLINSGLEMESIRFCSPAFVSSSDDHKMFMTMFNMNPVINDKNGRIYTFRVGYDHIEKNKIPKYDRQHITRNCFCSVRNSVPELSKFRDKDFQTIKVELDFEIDLSYLGKYTAFLDKKASTFRVLDTTGSIYEVYALIGEDGSPVEGSIPDKITGFYINRIPENKGYITAAGSKVINDTLPVGEITLLYQTISILTNGAKNSVEYLEYEPKNYMLDWMSDFVSLKVIRDPMENLVELIVSRKHSSDNQKIQLFYSDLIGIEQEQDVFNHLNLDKWFNLAKGRASVDNTKSLSSSMAVGSLDKTTASVIDIQNMSYKVYNKYSVDDVYIGAGAINPKRDAFRINKTDALLPAVGVPYNADTGEGIFIGYDDTCKSMLSEEAGQWIFRTRSPDSIYVPVGVSGEDSAGFIFEYERVPYKNTFSGRILTDGEFSSVVRSNVRETELGCPTNVLCSASYRYCGEDLLESEGSGWVKLEETDSTLINTLLGGYEGQRSDWMRHGAFSTAASDGVYRMGSSVAEVDKSDHDIGDGNFVYTRLPCHDGDYEATVGFKVSKFDSTASRVADLGKFVGDVSGYLSGVSPIHIYDGQINLKLSLAKSLYDQPLLLIMNGETNEILDLSFFDWEKFSHCHLTVIKNSELETITILSNESVISRLSIEDLFANQVIGCSLLNEPFFAIHLFDASSVDIRSFHDHSTGNVLDISLIEFSGKSTHSTSSLEDDDILISTDSKIEFNFKNRPIEIFSEDGYIDYYSDAYSEAYVEDTKFDVDEICFTSDRLRYLFDTGESEAKNRISVFKDGKGFLNFRIIDSPKSLGKLSTMYNIATNIKHFKPSETHHIAASWRLNTIYEKDEMHLFVDGLEAPNLYRFGGPVKTKINDKFSDVSKEVLQDFLTDNIEYGQVFTDGVMLAGTSKFISKDAGFSKDMVGRSVVIKDSDIAQIYIGGEYIINSVNEDEVTFVQGGDLDIVTFNASASDVSFYFPPTAGIKSRISTDLRNSKFSVYKKDCDGNSEEMGGVLYYVDNGDIVIISGEDIVSPAYRANVDTRIIEFIGKDDLCKYRDTINFSDLDIHIKTFGLKFALFNEKINLSSSSYFVSDKVEEYPNSGKSVLMSHALEPVSIEDVEVRRVVLDRVIPEVSNVYFPEEIRAEFNIHLDKSDGTHKLVSEPGAVHNVNRGRYLEVIFDSDNTVFCSEVDGYAEGYAEGATGDADNIIRVIGKTTDGTNFEEFNIRKNGAIRGNKVFLEVDEIVGSISIADPDYEPFVLEIVEADPITISNNDGEYAEVFRYVNGSFILTVAGSNGTLPFELHPGDYKVRYPSHLSVNIPSAGDKMFLGCDIAGGSEFGGIVDEFRVITEMSSDTRNTERVTPGTRSITRDYHDPNPLCADDQTLFLAHFDNPIKEQSRRLRQKEFLDREGNFKYRMDLRDREELLSVVNDKDKFESRMIRMGFDRDVAKQVFTEVHHAQGGPVFNEARYRRSDEMLVSSNSVNSSFGISAKFFDTPPLIVSNKEACFRKDEGTIEMWVSPLLDSIMDQEDRYFLDVYSILKKRVTSSAPSHISLPSPAKKIIKIELIQNTSDFSEFALESDADKAFVDEVYRSKVTGRLTGGTGVGKDFSTGCRISPDGRQVFLQQALPGSNVSVVVSYVPKDSSGNRVSIYKNKKSQIVFSMKTEGVVNVVAKDIDWKRNSWHRIVCTYRANSSSDYMRMFVDGVDCSPVTYGDQGLLYGDGALYGQKPEYSSDLVPIKISLKDDFRAIAIGSDIFGDHSALSRVDNIRFSREARLMPKDPSGAYIDSDYSPNLESVIPVVKDDLTTILINFEKDGNNESYAVVVDPKGGIFNFDIEVLDYFSKINDEVIEDLIVQLVNRLKPAHTNAVVAFPRESC